MDVRRVIIQLELDVVFDLQADVLAVRSPDRPRQTSGLSHFQPLQFVPYLESPLLYAGSDRPVNRDHPFALWFIEKADSMAREAPALFARLRGSVIAEEQSASERVRLINEALDTLSRLDGHLQPPRDAYLDESAFAE